MTHTDIFNRFIMSNSYKSEIFFQFMVQKNIIPQLNIIFLGLVYTSDRSDGSGVISGVGIGREF